VPKSKTSGNKVIIIAGPTASGKTSLALALASRINGELISADSRQIYRGLDVGTGKDTLGLKAQKTTLEGHQLHYYSLGRKKIKLWLTDLITPNQSFSVANYLPLARLLIKDIQNRGKIPILVGGTGLYLRALREGLGNTLPPHPVFRRFLSLLSTPALSFLLKAIYPSRYLKMTPSDQKNPRRLTRALELSLFAKPFLPSPKDPNPYFFILLQTDLKKLRSNIDKRVKKRLHQGLLKEITRLTQKYSWTDPGLNTLAYRDFKPYFQGLLDLKTCLRNWTFNEYHYASRQLTWFKKEKVDLCLDSQDPYLKKKAFLALSKMLQLN
jgi:tRNA dimethylallyltransferase